VYFLHAVNAAGVKKYTLGQGRFAGVDMCGNAYVPNLATSFHFIYSFFLFLRQVVQSISNLILPFLLVCFVRGCVRIFLGISPNMPHFPSLPQTNPLAQKQEFSTFQCSIFG